MNDGNEFNFSLIRPQYIISQTKVSDVLIESSFEMELTQNLLQSKVKERS
jgi:hypothetical protein